jgi:uncharacterized protein YecE (DUF72 family)
MSTSTLWAGASGYAFKEWKGTFYPEKMQPEAMLAWYAERLPAVEINNTFYQMPKVAVLGHWVEATPEAFRFAIKASRRITHDARLKADEAADSVAYLYKNLATLGAKRGPVLFQLPPFLKKDLPRLSDFLALLPEGHRAVFEFRNESWFDDDVYAALKAAGAALCLSEREDNAPPPLVETAPWGYLRLRLESYSDADLAQWAERLAATAWQEAHVYFMHEPTAPGYASALAARPRRRERRPSGRGPMSMLEATSSAAASPEPSRLQDDAPEPARRRRGPGRAATWMLLGAALLLALAAGLGMRQAPHPDMWRSVGNWDLARWDWWAYPLERNAFKRLVVRGDLRGVHVSPDGSQVWAVGTAA